MSLSTQELKNAVATLATSVRLYKEARSQSDEQIAFRDACIQRFEYCIELSWKLSMKILGSTTLAPKPAIREMARNGLIDKAELWLTFIDARNNTSHSYDENVAAKVFETIQIFLKEVLLLVSRLEKQ